MTFRSALIIAANVFLTLGCSTIDQGVADHYNLSFTRELTAGIDAYRSQQYALAATHLVQAREIAEPQYGGDSWQALGTLVWLARTSDSAGALDDARGYYDVAMSRLEERNRVMIAKGTVPNNDLALVQEQRAAMEYRHGEPEQGRHWADAASAAWVSEFGPEPPAIVAGLRRKAQRYRTMQMLEESAILEQRANEIDASTTGPN